MPAGLTGVLPFRFCEVRGALTGLATDAFAQSTVVYPFDDDAAAFESTDRVLNDV